MIRTSEQIKTLLKQQKEKRLQHQEQEKQKQRQIKAQERLRKQKHRQYQARLEKEAQERLRKQKHRQYQARLEKEAQKALKQPQIETTLHIYKTSNLIGRAPSDDELYQTREELIQAEQRGEGKINWNKWNELVTKTKKELGMAKRPIRVWIYKNHQFVAECESMSEAVSSTQDSATAIRTILDQPRASKRGYVYTTEPLTQEEMQHMPTLTAIQEERANDRCKVVLSEKQEIEVSCYDHKVFHLEPTKEARKAQLRQYVFSKLTPYWMTLPQSMANLHKRFIQEIIDSF